MPENNFDVRLSRLETITETIVSSLQEIKNEIKQESKVNWAPVAIGVTVFFSVAGSVATIYNTRISTLNNAVESIATRSIDNEKTAVEHQLLIQSNKEKIDRVDKDLGRVDERLREIESDKD